MKRESEREREREISEVIKGKWRESERDKATERQRGGESETTVSLSGYATGMETVSILG